MAKNEQVRIDLTAEDHASGKIADVADDVERLEDADPKVTIEADDNASTTIADVEADARALSAVDAEVVLKAKVDQAKGELAALRADLTQTGEKAEDTARQLDRVGEDTGGGISTRGNAIADLTGPLGEASGAASDFAGVADGLTDIVGDLATKLGATPAMAQKIAGAMGGLGIAVAAGAAVWSLYSARQQKAAEDAKKMAEAAEAVTDALREGNRVAAAEAFKGQFGDLIADAKQAGYDVQSLTSFIVDAKRNVDTLNYAGSTAGVGPLGPLITEIDHARTKWQESTEAVLANKDVLGEVTAGMGPYAAGTERAAAKQDRLTVAMEGTRDALDEIRGRLNMDQAILTFQTNFAAGMASAQDDTALTAEEILSLKQDYLNVAEELGKSPIEIATDLEKIDAGQIGEVLWTTQEAINRRPPLELKTRLGLPVNFGDERFYRAGAPSSAAASSVVNVTQYIPRGFRGDALAQARDAARRSGRLYRRAG